jgi:predicted O-methyltransferase YrrM
MIKFLLKLFFAFCLFSTPMDVYSVSLDEFLHDHGFFLNPIHSPVNEGYMSDSQKEQFIEKLSTYKGIKRIAEIGLNAGHSAEVFFNTCKELELFVSFDINHYPYTPVAVKYFYREYGNKFIFNPGDSLQTVPRFQSNYPFMRFDLIFIDGCHAYEWAMGDLINMKRMAHPKTVLWIDDVPPDFSGPIGLAVRTCEAQGIIRIIKLHDSSHPIQFGRHWVEAEYIFP